jgi:plasmid stabilization system protein ParE
VTGPKFFAEALAEYEDAVVYYEKREEGLGARLVQEFDEAVAVALEYPEAFATVQEVPVAFGLRWVMLRSFPIKLVYTVRDETLLLVAVFHARRRPGYWLERLKQLGR